MNIIIFSLNPNLSLISHRFHMIVTLNLELINSSQILLFIGSTSHCIQASLFLNYIPPPLSKLTIYSFKK